MVLRHTSVARKDAQDGQARKKELRALETYARVIQRGGGIAGSGLRGKLARADRQPHDVGGLWVHQECAVVTRDRVVFSEANEVVAIFIRNMKAELGEWPAILSH